MKILHVMCSVNPQGGGPIEAMKQIATVLTAQDYTIEFACLDPPNADWLTTFPFKVYALGPGIFSYHYSPQFLPWLRQNIAKYDRIVVNGIWQYHSFATWLALRQTSTKYFVYTHGMLDPWFKVTYPLKHLKKWLYWPWAEYRVLQDAHAVLFTTESEKILARQSFWLYKCHEVVVNYGTASPTGNIELQRQDFFKQFPDLQDKRLLLFLSRIHIKKGCDLLLEAFAKVTDVDDSLHLVMAGPDQSNWQAQLQIQAEKLGISQRITWTGMLSGDLKWGAFHAAEVFVLPSHQENFGIVVAEALACGLPVLISNKVNIWQEVIAEEAGLVANDDLEGTIKLIKQWLSMLSTEQQLMRKKAKQCFLSHFEINQAVNSLINVLHS